MENASRYRPAERRTSARNRANSGTALRCHATVKYANGKVQNATTAQVAGALDDLYAAANDVPDLGAVVRNGSTSFKVWAPTAQAVSAVLTTPLGNSGLTRTSTEPMTRDATTGVWSLVKPGNLQGTQYRYQVQVFVKGVGLVKNLVTDPYSLGLTLGSQQSVVVDLQSPQTKPAGWDLGAPLGIASKRLYDYR